MVHFRKLETHENYITGAKYISESPVLTRKEQKLELCVSMSSEKNTTLLPIFLHTGRHLLWIRISKKKNPHVFVLSAGPRSISFSPYYVENRKM